MKNVKKVVISGMLGNALEWYDYALYGHFAVIISKLFFPESFGAGAVMATFGIFAIGFVMRPIGALLFGYIGDEYGRKTALAASILLMAIPTAAIGILPTYAQIGIAAPILLIVIRLLQGISLGGEFSGSIAYTIEFSPNNKKGLIGSTSLISAIFGILLGTIAATLTSNCFSPEDFENFGWRIPFLFGIVAGLVGFYIRNNLEESPVYEELKRDHKLSKMPIRDVIRSHKRAFFSVAAIYALVTVPFYNLTAYFTTYLVEFTAIGIKNALTINMIAMLVIMIFTPIGGYLSDKFGRKKVLMISAIVAILMFLPLFYLMQSGEIVDVLIAQIIFAAVIGIYLGPVPAVLVEAFPPNIRYTAMSLSYNLTVAIFGGTTPLIATFLISITHSTIAPAFYLVFSGVIALIGLLFFKDNYRHRTFSKIEG